MSREPGAARGDEAELYERLNQPLERVVRARLRGPAAALEDACAFAWEQLLRCQPERSEALFAWLVTVATHEGWRLVRIERRARAAEPGVLDSVPGPERELEARMWALAALQALAALRSPERRLLALRAAGYSYRELAALEESSYTAVNRHLTRARNRVREGRGARFGG